MENVKSCVGRDAAWLKESYLRKNRSYDQNYTCIDFDEKEKIPPEVYSKYNEGKPFRSPFRTAWAKN